MKSSSQGATPEPDTSGPFVLPEVVGPDPVWTPNRRLDLCDL